MRRLSRPVVPPSPAAAAEMYSYRSLNSRERWMTWNATRRRLLLIVTCFVILAVTLFVGVAPRRKKLEYFDLKDKSHHGVLPLEHLAGDHWTPPKHWDAMVSVADDFTKIEERFSASVNNLAGGNGMFGRQKPKPYNPYPDYNSDAYKRLYLGDFVSCVGPRGVRLNESVDDAVLGYVGSPKDFPEPALGSSKVLGLDQNVCFERYGRLGAYGLEREPLANGQSSGGPAPVDWDEVDWAALQRQCVDENSNRFDMTPRPMPGERKYEKPASNAWPTNEKGTLKKRTALVFRSYDGMSFTPELVRTMRSVVAEAALGSGGEYEAFLLVQVKDLTKPIFDDPQEYQKVVEGTVPKEFWGMTVLWNEALWDKLYPLVPLEWRNVHTSQWFPVQWLAQMYPNFDHYWNWEMDIRYTGHHYELLEGLDKWTTKQPRKGLWERNSRFYIPRYHGDYETNFMQYVQARYQSGTGQHLQDASIWGPELPPGQEKAPWDELPPLNSPTPANDDFKWGVGDDADLITLLPMINPDPTHYAFRHGHFNYPMDLIPLGPPRRVTIVTFYRFSNRLLSTMHQENTHAPGHHMSSEQWPQGVALHHGFKGVYAPHSIHMDKHWPAKALDFIFNNGDTRRTPGKDVPMLGEGSGDWESVFGFDREYNFDGSTWYYRNDFGKRLYRRLLGYNVDDVGGEEWETQNGNFCLPPILIHPIKEITDPEPTDPNESPETKAARLATEEAAAKAADAILAEEDKAMRAAQKLEMEKANLEAKEKAKTPYVRLKEQERAKKAAEGGMIP